MNRNHRHLVIRPSAKESATTSARRPSFTLLELLISLGIILILATLTMRLLNATLNSDRIRNGSRELQSFLVGARDRAIHAGQPRGVRLIPDPTNQSIARSFVYVGASTSFTDSTQLSIDAFGNLNFIQANSPPAAPPLIKNYSLVWTNLWNLGLLPDGTPIQLTVGTTPINLYLTVSWTGMTPTLLPVGQPQTAPTFAVTTVPVGTTFPIDNPTVLGGTGASYALQLGPTIVSGDEPRSLPANVVIDLNSSILPLSWGSAGTFTSPLDIMFSSQGTVMGAPASDGRIHFVLSDLADVTGQKPIGGLPARSPLQLNAPWQPNTTYVPGNVIVPTPSTFIAFRCLTGGTTGAAASEPGWPTQANQTVPDSGGVSWQSFAKNPNLIVSLATATGRVTTHPVDLGTQLIPAGSGYDSFRFAETGEVTQ